MTKTVECEGANEMKYKIVRGSTITHLEASVNEHIETGWIPQGSFMVLEIDPNFNNKQSYGQVLIKKRG